MKSLEKKVHNFHVDHKKRPGLSAVQEVKKKRQQPCRGKRKKEKMDSVKKDELLTDLLLNFNNIQKVQNCYEMNTKIEIKEEFPFTDVISHSEEYLCKDKAFGLSSNASAKSAEMDSNTNVKEESFISGFCSQNKEEYLIKIKTDTVTASSDNERSARIEVKEEILVSNPHIQNDMNIKVEPNEEQWWQEGTLTETPCLYDVVKNESDGNFTSAESFKLCTEELSSIKVALCSEEDMGKDMSFDVKSVSSDYELSRKYKNQERDITQISSIETVVHSYQFDSVELESMAYMRQNYITQRKDTEDPDMCNKTCAYKATVVRDDFDHETDKEHKCSSCNKAFTYLSNLKTHMLIHNDEKSHECGICKKSFTQLSTLNQHNLVCEGKKPCEKSSTQVGNWSTQNLIHEDRKPYKCKICEKAFAHLDYLKRHNFIHEGVKLHKCDICNQWFRQSAELKRHAFLHEGKKPYKCHICEKAFARLDYLKKHKLIHEDDKQYKCHICEKAFARLDYLKKHKLIHEDKNQYRCHICEKSFTQLRYLKQHILIHKV